MTNFEIVMFLVLGLALLTVALILLFRLSQKRSVYSVYLDTNRKKEVAWLCVGSLLLLGFSFSILLIGAQYRFPSVSPREIVQILLITYIVLVISTYIVAATRYNKISVR